MKLYSTRNKSYLASLSEAVMQGLPPDNGLYMPTQIPSLSPTFWGNLAKSDLPEIGFHVSKNLFGNAIPEADLWDICSRALTFSAPIVTIDDKRHILELFHGPSLAFKDFGARYMAQLMSYFNRSEDQPLTILVATSGDTGGAVAAGFYKTPGIEVVILYPSGKVSPLQEKQLTTLGHNIRALEIEGTFDDCQTLVKQAFLDQDLAHKMRLSSANSINIARLIPQSFYYFEAYRQLTPSDADLAFVVPSGNFGNLTAGLFAQHMGLPIKAMVAATNVNDIVPNYLVSGKYNPRPSVRTLSNAMDVGAPSNFARMQDLFSDLDGSTWNNMKKTVWGYSYSDRETEVIMQKVFAEHNYTLDPHSGVGYLAMNAFLADHQSCRAVLLETAHPAKFLADVNRILDTQINVPDRLEKLRLKTKNATLMPVNFEALKDNLIQNQ
ncbi:MAG: threonine synthase [Saprospiraceae bacterium]|nr:threonine synthase [Saprospiraceae bacterium]